MRVVLTRLWWDGASILGICAAVSRRCLCVDGRPLRSMTSLEARKGLISIIIADIPIVVVRKRRVRAFECTLWLLRLWWPGAPCEPRANAHSTAAASAPPRPPPAAFSMHHV